MTSSYQFNHFSSGTKWSHDVGYDTKDLNFAEQMLRAHNYQFGVLKEINSPVVERAFNAWIKYINLNANLVSPTSLPWLKDITIVESSTLLDQENKAVGGVTIAPNQQLNQRIVVVINANLGGGYNDGDKKYSTLIHEIGHALGLFTSGSVTHPHQHNSAYRQDTTVMSYIDGAYIGNGIGQKYASTPMMYDIAALQHLYGAKGDTTSGNNRYEITDTKKGWTIWDSGGKDTLDASALPASRSVLIDLRGGTDENNNVYFSQTVNGFLKPEEGKYYGKPYGSKEVVAIAYQDANTSQDKVRIEDGWGGAGHDVLIGGKGANELKGNGGNDTLIGGNGIDTLDGGAGIDFLYGDQDDVLKGGEHTDLIASYQGVEQEDGSVLLGSTSWAQLYGGTGEDALTGDGATDHFGIFGLGIVKGGAEKIDRVYVNNRQATGGETPFIYDMPAAWNPWQGHLLALFNGSPQEENGATLGVKWLWDNDAIALIENYTHRYLEDGDAAIETYRQYLADKWDIASLFANLWNSVKAINFYRNNPDPETISVASSSPSASPSAARTAQFAAAASAPAQNIPVNKTTPFLKGNAQLTDLDTAMSSDATLRTMITNLAGRSAAALTAFDAEVRNILFRWAKVDSVADDARGVNVNAKELVFLEKYAGVPFVSTTNGSANPNFSEAMEHKSVWDEVYSEMRGALLAQTVYASHFSGVMMGREDGRFITPTVDLRGVVKHMIDNMPSNAAQAMTYWEQRIAMLHTIKPLVERKIPITKDFFGNTAPDVSTQMGMMDHHLLTDIIQVTSGRTLPLTLAQMLEKVTQTSTLLAPPKITLASAGANMVGSGGNDFIIFDRPTATSVDGKGNDTYIVGKDFTSLTITDSGASAAGSIFSLFQSMFPDNDALRFTHLMRKDARIDRVGDDLVITNKLTNGTVRVVNNFAASEDQILSLSMSGSAKKFGIEQITFADGEAMIAVDILEEIITRQETDGNDFIRGTVDAEIIHGRKGRDTLVGGDAGDMYKFNVGDGFDIVRDHQDNFFDERPDQMKFGAGLDLSKAVLTRGTVTAQDGFVEDIVNGDSLRIAFHTGDSIVIDGQFWNSGLGTGTFDAHGVFFNLISFFPLLGLLGGGIPSNFDNYGTKNDLGLAIRTDPTTNKLIVDIRDTDYFIIAPDFTTRVDNPATSLHTQAKVFDGTFSGNALSETPFSADSNTTPDLSKGIIATPDRRIESFMFMDGYLLGIKEMHQAYLNQFNRDAADRIIAFHESETLQGGKGNDTLSGGDDGDTYLFNLGDGKDVIEEAQTNILFKKADKIIFGEGITPADISITSQNENQDLLITINNTQDSILIKGQLDAGVFGWHNFYTVENRIEYFQFHSGTLLTANDMAARLLNPTTGSDVLYGNADHDIIYGGKGGNDTLIGGDGGDAYIFGFGDGQDVIHDKMFSALLKFCDSVYFGEGITKDNLELSRPYQTNDLVIHLTRNGQRTGDSLTIKDQFKPSVFGYDSLFSVDDNIELFLFQDGSGWTYRDMMERLLRGTNGNDSMEGFFNNDTFDGGAGNDIYYGDGEADTYVFTRGYGQDSIVEIAQPFESTYIDTVRLEGLKVSDVIFSRPTPWDLITDDLVISIRGTSDTLTIKSTFNYAHKHVERFQFMDANLKLSDIRTILANQDSNGNDTLNGFYDTYDIFQPTLGNDTLRGGDGDDIYHYRLGSGHDVIDDGGTNVASSDNDRIIFDAAITPQNTTFARENNDLILRFAGNTTDSVRVRNHFDVLANNINYERISGIEFSDRNKTLWDAEFIDTRIGGTTAGNDLLRGTFSTAGATQKDRLFGAAGNDTLIADRRDTLCGGAGNDLYLYQDPVSSFVTEASFIYEAGGGGNDTLRLPSGIALDQLTFARENQGRDLVIHSNLLSGSSGVYVTLWNFFLHPMHQIETLQLQQNGTITSHNLVNYVTRSTANADYLLGTNASESFSGLAGNDRINGYSGNDTIIGGTGNDWLAGGAWDDMYLYNNGDGNDTIFDMQDMVENSMQDVVRFGVGITPQNIRLLRVGTGGKDMQISFQGLAGSVLVQDFFNPHNLNRIELFEFNDAARTVWSLGDIYAALPAQPTLPAVSFDLTTSTISGGVASETLTGNDGHNYFVAGKGNDRIVTLNGSDTIAYALGDGNDTIGDDQFWRTYDHNSDHIIFSGNITLANTTLTRTGYQGIDMVMRFNDGGTLTLMDQNRGHYERIEYFHFSDGTMMNWQDIDRCSVPSTYGLD